MKFNQENWINIGKYFLLFFYFSAVYQSLCFIFDISGFIGLREAFYMNFLWLIPILIFQKYSKQIAAAIGVFLWLASLPSLCYFLLYNQEFSQSVIYIIFESNIVEGTEFFKTYFVWWLIPVIVIYSIIPYYFWKSLKNINIHINKTLILIPLSLLIVTKTFAKLYIVGDTSMQRAVIKQIDKMQAATPWNLVLGYIAYKEVLANMEELLTQNSNLPPVENLKNLSIEEENTLVLVIGESTNRNRMSLYGYKRDTTPRLNSIKDELVVFKNVYSPRPYTIEVLQQALTFADEKNPDLYLTKVNLLNIMKQAGYKTYWITNQQTQTQRNTMLTTFSKIADEQIYLNNNRRQNSSSYDEVVLEPFNKVLNDTLIKKKFIVVHLLGTHSRYDYRYPENFAKFDGLKVSPLLNEKQTNSYNSYDNAVYYNDYVVSNLISSVKALNTSASLLYLSDHGEEVFDEVNLEKMGRNEGAPTSAMYSVPFIIYGNKKWQESNNISKLKTYTNRLYSSSNLLYTFSDFAKLDFKDLDLSKSIISESFEQKPVFIGDPYNKAKLRDLVKTPFETKTIKIGA
ncbi:phosphoethanolamine transferase CptA [Malaciobacter mytili]|uniref:phosphoethanolamine transferase CptA n=1 Tax=Malaciobacter mytili TaxID=603050 RepID=UPI003BB0DFD5